MRWDIRKFLAQLSSMSWIELNLMQPCQLQKWRYGCETRRDGGESFPAWTFGSLASALYCSFSANRLRYLCILIWLWLVNYSYFFSLKFLSVTFPSHLFWENRLSHWFSLTRFVPIQTITQWKEGQYWIQIRPFRTF